MRSLLSTLLALMMLVTALVSAAQAWRVETAQSSTTVLSHAAEPCHEDDANTSPDNAEHTGTHTGSCAALCALLAGCLPASPYPKAAMHGKSPQPPHLAAIYLDALVAGLDRPPKSLL